MADGQDGEAGLETEKLISCHFSIVEGKLPFLFIKTISNTCYSDSVKRVFCLHLIEGQLIERDINQVLSILSK